MPNLRLKNVADTITSLFSNAATVARQWFLPDKDGTVAMLDDVAVAQAAAATADGKAVTAQADIDAHEALTNNPHAVTKSQVGLSNVPNLSFSGSNTGDQDISGIATNAAAISSHVANTSNPHSVTAAQVGAYTTAQDDTLLAAKVDEETFATLTFGTPTNWDTNSRQSPEAKVTATGSFTINMTNVKSGSNGILKLITNTASAIVLTFDTDFTNKRLGTTGQESFTTYTFPAATAKEYMLFYVCDGTTLYWYIDDSGTVVDWSTGVTPVGWASYTIKTCFYIDYGKFILMTGQISGLGSGTTGASIALPVAPNSTIYTGSDNVPFLYQAFNNVTASTGMITLTGGSLSANAYTSLSGGAWTANTTRQIRFTIMYFK